LLASTYSVELSPDNYTVMLLVWRRISDYNDIILRGKQKEITIDFVDMIYIPVVYSSKFNFPSHDIVYADEAQDLSVCQQSLIRLAIGDGKAVYVGDPRQSIYSFCGADSSSWRKLETAKNTIQLTLPVCYRCAVNVVNKARTVYDHIQPFDGQIDGEVIESGDVFEAVEGDFILCRNTRPLVSLWYLLVADGKRVVVKGDEDKRELLKLSQKYAGESVTDAFNGMAMDLAKLAEHLVNSGVEKPREHRKYIEFAEMVECLKVIVDSSNSRSMVDVASKIEAIFSDDSSDKLILMTMHKSKGLESDNVYVVMPSLLPSKWAKTDVEIEQEKNLEYVAYTRAKRKLVIDRTWKYKD